MVLRINSSLVHTALLGLSVVFIPLCADSPALPPAIRPNTGMAPNAKMPPELTKEDLAMLQEVEQEINKFVDSLPPEEQKKFWNEVDELTKVMSTMSEDELINFMETALAQEAPAIPAAPAVTLPPTQVYEPAKAPVEVIKPTIAPNKQEAAIELIDGIVTRINNFLLKTQSIPEMPGKIKSWGTKGKLTGFTATSTWNSIRSTIEEFEQKLNKMKDRDAKTKQYKYLDDLIKNEALYNNLVRVRKTLDKNEPLIQIASFGLDRMETESRQATVSVINILTEANTVLAIPAALDTIVEKYEPTAKKLKESEELARKQALEASKRPVTQMPTSVGRTPRRGDQFGAPSWYGKDTGYTPSAPQQQKPVDRTPKDKAEEGKKPEAPKEAGKPKEPAKPVEKKKREDDKIAGEIVKDFRKTVDDITFAIEDHKELEQLLNHFNDPNQNVKSDVSDAINTMKSSLSKAVSNLKQLKRRMQKLTPEQQAEYRTDIKDIVSDFKKPVDKLLSQINQVESQKPVISLRGGPKTDQKYYAYMGGPAPAIPTTGAAAGAAPVTSSANLLDFRDKMKDFEEAYAEFEKAGKTLRGTTGGTRAR